MERTDINGSFRELGNSSGTLFIFANQILLAREVIYAGFGKLIKSATVGAMALALGLSFSSSLSQAASKGSVGIAMPTKSLARWVDDGDNMVKQFEAAGYEAELQYASDDVATQLRQIETMILKGVDVLVIASIDGTALSSALDLAAESGIKVISYDRLIRESPNVDYYATFDNFQVGVIQAESLLKGLDIENAKGPLNIEVFGGSPDDNNAYFFYNGAMSILQPYLDSGKLVVVSGQMGMDKVGTLFWDGATAQARMDNLLSAFYTDKKVDGVLSPNDSLAIGVISSLKGVGYGTADMPMPIITGQDAEVANIKAMIKGEQYSTVFKDTRALAGVTVGMVDAILNGGEPEINDTKTYDNGKKIVPSYLLKPVAVTQDNWKEILVDSGYYSEDQFKD